MVEFQPEIIRESLDITKTVNPQEVPTLDVQQTALPDNPIRSESATQTRKKPVANAIQIENNVRESKEAERDFLVPEIYNNVSANLVVEEIKINNVGINIYKMPFFTHLFCDTLIADAEQCDGWTSDRHDNYPTTDIPLIEMGGPDGRNWDETYEDYLTQYAYPIACDVWNIEKGNFLSETFIAKYEVQNQSHLDIHHDQSAITFVTTLNDDFEGGGTYFDKWGVTVNLPKGWMAFHPGYCGHKHGARPVTSGTRYICIAFAGKV